MADVFSKYGPDSTTGGGLAGGEAVDGAPVYSEDYQKFKSADFKKTYQRYESICNISAKIYSPKLKPEKQEELQAYLDVTHLNTTPGGVMSYAMLASIFWGTLGLGLAIYLVMAKAMLYALMLPVALGLIVYVMLAGKPKRMFVMWQANAADQIVLAVLYMIISMKRDGNLEHAVYYAAKETPPPLSLDFMRILWQFQSGTYSTVAEAMDAYLTVWKGKEDGFVDAVNLIEASRFATSKEKAEKLLDKSVDVALTSVKDNMTHFAHGLQGPIKTLYMLGIVLPVLMLVMLPLAGSFLDVGALPIAGIFDLAIPIAVYMIAKSVLAKRPGGVGRTSKDIFEIKLAKRKAAAVFFSLLIFALMAAPFVLVVSGILGTVGFGGFSNAVIFGLPGSPDIGTTVLNTSILFTAGVGLSIAFYYWFVVRGVLKLKEQVERIEGQFSSAIFQLGSRIEEGVPTELAFSKVAESTRGTDVSKMFTLIDQNLRTKGMSLKEAIFDKSTGAAWLFPSALIRSILKLVVEGAKKSLKSVAESLLILSQYLKNMHTVSERMKDLLADTISSMQMQASFMVALITGVVVSLSVLIVQILIQLATSLGKMGEAGAGAATSEYGSGADMGGLLNLFSPENAIAPYVFQLTIGIYVIIVVIIITYLLSRVVYGADEIRRKHATASNLFKSVLVYCIVSFLGSKFLGGIAGSIITAGGG